MGVSQAGKPGARPPAHSPCSRRAPLRRGASEKHPQILPAWGRRINPLLLPERGEGKSSLPFRFRVWRGGRGGLWYFRFRGEGALLQSAGRRVGLVEPSDLISVGAGPALGLGHGLVRRGPERGSGSE